MRQFFYIYLSVVSTVIAVGVTILAYAEASGENLRNSYYANHGFYCGSALYRYDWGGAGGFYEREDNVIEACGFHPRTGRKSR